MKRRGAGVALLAATGLLGQTADYQPTVLSVRINGVAPQGAAASGLILFQEGARLFASRADLTALSLRLPSDNAFEVAGVPYVALDALNGLAYEIAADQQELEIHAPASAFLGADAAGQAGLAPTQSGTGAFLNYDLEAQRDGPTGLGVLLQGGIFNRWGLLTSSFSRSVASRGGLVRLNSSYLLDFPARRESLLIGDSTARAGAWGQPIYFGGVHWGTDFTTQPDLVTFPVPAIKGQAVAPSTASLYVNGVLRQSMPVTAGPFEINAPPVVSGPGQVTLVVQDVLGRQTIATLNYFATPGLLRPGMADYSIDTGVLRNSFGTAESSYAGLFATGLYRRGWTNRLTTEVRAEAAGGLGAFGATATYNPFRALLASASLVSSRRMSAAGNMAGAQAAWQGRAFSLGVQGQRATPGFHQLGYSSALPPPRRQIGAFLGISLFGRDHFTASYFRLENRPGSGSAPASIASGSFSTNLGRRTFVSATFTRMLTAPVGSLAAISITYQIDERTTLAPTMLARGGSGGTEEAVTVQRNLPLGPGTGYRVTLANDRQDADVLAAGSAGTYELEMARAGGNTAVRAGVRGALGWVRNRVIKSRSIDDAFAIVRVGHFPGVHVLADNQPVAVTDADGVAIVPRLRSLQANRISIDPGDLPLEASVGAVEMVVRPARRAGIRVDFPVAESSALLIHLVDADGSPLPAGALVTVAGVAEEFPVAREGAAYLTGLEPGALRLSAKWPGGSCTAALRVTSDDLKPGAEKGVSCETQP